MSAAFVEHRPRSTDSNATTTHYTVVVNGSDNGTFTTQSGGEGQGAY